MTTILHAKQCNCKENLQVATVLGLDELEYLASNISFGSTMVSHGFQNKLNSNWIQIDGGKQHPVGSQNYGMTFLSCMARMAVLLQFNAIARNSN